MFADAVVLAPLTVGGNLPFRRLCSELGADVTVGEMAVVRKLLRGSTPEFALLKSHPQEKCFGVQLADNKPDSLAEGARLAESRGARFVDLNCGCPIDQITRRGLGASLLRKPTRLGRLVAAMKGAVSVPVTVKLRAGWSEAKANVREVARVCEESGADAIAIHGRTRDQRYSRAADWDLIGCVAAERGVPVIGNGDLLTPYEARERMARTGVRSVMLGRGALIKPWLFGEIKTGRSWLPSAEERFSLLWRFVELLRDHFGEDERGTRRALRFLPWHLNFFCRYVPLPEEVHAEAARAHPLIQSRLQAPPAESALERLLGDDRPETHEAFARELLGAVSRDEAHERALRLAVSLPAGGADGELRLSSSEVAG
ncbi:MAG: tRNA dihydrouridine synthase [Betaproteobacteria bacterium]